jgi:hypothetical protein
MEIFSNTTGHSTGWIAKVLGNDDNGRPLKSDEMTANACLIAAAPELLDVLRDCSYRWDKYDEDDDPDLGKRIRDVLAKAEGRGDARS